MSTPYRLIFTTCGSEQEARRIAELLIEKKTGGVREHFTGTAVCLSMAR